MRPAIAMLLALAATAAAAEPKLACTIDANRSYWCIDENGVTAGTGKHGTLRASKLYIGAPNGADDSGLVVIANCYSNILVIQDSRGVNVSAGASWASALSQNLSRWICEAKKFTPDPQLRQFGLD